MKHTADGRTSVPEAYAMELEIREDGTLLVLLKFLPGDWKETKR